MPINTFTYKESYKDNVKLDLIELTLGQDGLGYYLSPRYRLETEKSIREIYIPKARLNVNCHDLVVDLNTFTNNYRCNLIPGGLELYADAEGHAYYDTVIKEKTYDMTLEEIEKKLGYKVRIITKET